MNIFKISYKVVRENSKDIYKGFGFKHLSDATQYYVHPNNQSFSGTTTLCQPIGESLILFASMIFGITSGNGVGDYYVSDDRDTVFLDVAVPDDYRENEVVEKHVYKYRALCKGNSIKIAAYDYHGRWIDGNMEHLRPLYKLLPCFCVLLAREMETEPDYRVMMEKFMENPVADAFVNLHEDFYQNHKMDEFEIEYTDLSYIDTKELRSFSSSYQVVKENKEQLYKTKLEALEITSFDPNAFTREQLMFVPRLSPEFVLPRNLHSICNAIASGDIISVLFHGPAGTGKTMSCKLICQAIGLPVMETINCTENLDEFVLGKFIPEDDRIVFRESYVTRAIRDGGAVVFEEINFAKPQYLAFVNSLLDDNGFARLDNGQVVKRHPNFRFFATMNIGYFGTKELNQALYNRFNAVVEIAALSDEAISRMLIARVPECKPVVDKILGVYHKIKKKIETEELDIVISPRNLENWARLARYEGYINAAEKTIIPVAKCDRALEEAIRGIIVLYKWK
ncbi:MAG: AAA family ATPase [Clostridiaceae bacterium]|nr:AAA family ATPase [Clostridiaceae bacterium]